MLIHRLRPLLLALVAASAAMAQEATPPPAPAEPPPPAPTADEINRVTAYYLKGRDGGPILIDFRLCATIGKNEEKKNVCESEYGDTAASGDQVNAFVRFFAPRGGKYEDLKVRFSHNGEVRSTTDMSVTESWTGYTNYKRTTVSKPGTWDIEVLRGDAVLAKKTLKVH